MFIGNSFSADSLQWLPSILNNLSVADATVAYLYIGGCSIQRHFDNIADPTNDYTYYKNTGCEWVATTEATLLHGITDEPWDIIVFQQASHFSGKPYSYTTLDGLIDYVDRHKTNPNVKYGFNMTWAYQSNAAHRNFADYGCNQITMYRAICATVKNIIAENSRIYKIFPTGTVIQNLRMGSIGDRLTRDGYHLSLHAGRLAAAMSIAYGLGYSVNEATFLPEGSDINGQILAEIKNAVINAYAVPFEITGV